MASEMQLLITSLGGFLVIVAGGIKWLLFYVDSKQTAWALEQSKTQEALSLRLHDEIKTLRTEVVQMHEEKKTYLRRIFQLEALIHTQAGLMMPSTTGWPPV